MKRLFAEWYSSKITEELQKGKQPHEVKVDVSLSKIEDVHLGWVRQSWA